MLEFVFLRDFKHDYEKWWDDAFARAWSDGKVGAFGGPTTLVCPPHKFPPNTGSGMDGLKVTRTIKMPTQVHLLGQGGMPGPRAGTLINGQDLLDTNDNFDRDLLHWGGDEGVVVHNSSIQNIGFRHAKRHGISSYTNGPGENSWLDRITVNWSGGAGVHIGAVTGFVPLRIGALNLSFNDIGLQIVGATRTLAVVDFISGDENIKNLIQVDGGTGGQSTSMVINAIKAQINKPNVMANIVNLRNGHGGMCRIGHIHADLVMKTPTHTETYRAINCTEGSPWRVVVDQFTRRDGSVDWNDELAFDDGRLQLRWKDVDRVSLDQRLIYSYLSWRNSGHQDGPDERLVKTTAQLENINEKVNKLYKKKGKEVFNETTGNPVWASGPLPGDPWVDAMGGILHVPKEV